MGIKDTIKGIFSTKKDISPSPENVRLYKYWMGQYSRAVKKQPKEEWESAVDRFAAKTPDAPFVNDFRKFYESSMAFLDQNEPNFKVMPEEAFAGDIDAQKAAECEALYLKKVWREQHCQRVQSRKLGSSLLRNLGVSMPYFDLKKWMPSVKYVPADKCLFDPDCNGILENAQWMGYFEDIPAEEFRSWHPELSKERFRQICEKGNKSTLSELESEGKDAQDLSLYSAVRVVHIYARNSSAQVLMEDKDDLDKGFAEELQLDTPRRYLQFVEGWNAPLIDGEWPFDLDHDEFPHSILQFNIVPEDIYGFTDYKQMYRLDNISDEVIQDIAKAAFLASLTKWAARDNMALDPVEIHEFLNNPNEMVLEKLLDSEGKPKIQLIERGQINGAIMNAYSLLHDQSKEASGQNELLENADAATFKEVTAIAARIADANQHQRINRRLGGPYGYEQSIAEDAVKMLEIAHQFVPQYSTVLVEESEPMLDEFGDPVLDIMTGEPVIGDPQERLKELPWTEALVALQNGGKLIKLGVDAIVGPELAQYWSYGMPAQQWRLSTKVAVEPGTTRLVTKEQQAAVMKQLFLEVVNPFLQASGRMDLARNWIESISRLSNVPNIDNLLPTGSDIQGVMQQQQAMMAEQQMQGQAGGQPLNSPDANGGEIQEQNADISL